MFRNPHFDLAAGLVRAELIHDLGGEPGDIDLFAAHVSASDAEQQLHPVEQLPDLLAGAAHPKDLIVSIGVQLVSGAVEE